MQLLNEERDDAPSLWCAWRVRFVDIWERLVGSYIAQYLSRGVVAHAYGRVSVQRLRCRYGGDSLDGLNGIRGHCRDPVVRRRDERIDLC